MISSIRFDELFQTNKNNSLSPLRNIKVNGTSLGPRVSFFAGESFGGVDFFRLKDKSLAIEDYGSYVEIRGVYNDKFEEPKEQNE